MTPKFGYATLAIYAKRADVIDTLTALLEVVPTRTEKKNGASGWFYTTRESCESVSIEDHLTYLAGKLQSRTPYIKQQISNGCEIRIWIYASIGDINHAFVISPELVTWLSEMQADICIDMWKD